MLKQFKDIVVLSILLQLLQSLRKGSFWDVHGDIWLLYTFLRHGNSFIFGQILISAYLIFSSILQNIGIRNIIINLSSRSQSGDGLNLFMRGERLMALAPSARDRLTR